MMEFFESLPDNLQQIAWRQLADQLVDAYADSTDSWQLEEELISALDDVITEKPQTFASKLEEFYAEGN